MLIFRSDLLPFQSCLFFFDFIGETDARTNPHRCNNEKTFTISEGFGITADLIRLCRMFRAPGPVVVPHFVTQAIFTDADPAASGGIADGRLPESR